MLAEPDFEPEFYEQQIIMMEKRYSKLFLKWHLSWNKYYNYVRSQLRQKDYWIWVYLCGFEKFVQEQGIEKEGRQKRLYQDADQRIARIIDDHYKVQNYVRDL